MHQIAPDLLIILGGVWLVAVTLRPLGLPTIMGELIVGVVLGPAVLGWIQPGELIQLLAEIGIFFLMFHAGVETQPVEFFQALKRSLGVANWSNTPLCPSPDGILSRRRSTPCANAESWQWSAPVV